MSLRPIPLPVVTLDGSIVPQPYSRLPSITLEMAVKQVAIDVTTDVLNQLLILQSAFIKVRVIFITYVYYIFACNMSNGTIKFLISWL